MTPPRATDAPTREGVTLHRNGLVEIPTKRKSWSEAGYRARYDTDPVVVWTWDDQHACVVRYRLAGPVSANVVLRDWIAEGRTVVVFWGDDSDPSAARDIYADRERAIPAELRELAARHAVERDERRRVGA